MENLNKKYTLGLMIFILTELMFFAGLLSSYWVLRSQVLPWPPLGQPRYPVYFTAFNTLVLLASGLTFLCAERRIQARNSSFTAWLLATVGAGTLFLLLQGHEWWKLLGFGLHAASNIYGGIFYLIVGAHAFHVAMGLAILAFVTFSTYGRQDERAILRINIARKYWFFVVGIWPVIYVALYLL